MKMKCSIIIPAYNAASSISSCLKSACDQSIDSKEYEIIVVNDGSTDETSEIVKSFPVKLIQQKNQGPAVARNRGAKEAAGDLLVFTDSDCILDRNFLEYILAPFEINDEIAGVQGRYRTKQSEFIARFVQIEIETRYNKMLQSDYIDFIGTYAAAYRRAIFISQNGFDTGFKTASGEDSEFSFKLHKLGYKMIFEPEALVYHQHPSSLKHYLKVKFSRGFWRIRLYMKHPKKMIKDSYTTQKLKIEVLCSPLLILFLLLTGYNKNLFLAFFIVANIYIFSSFEFIKAFKKNKYKNYYIIPIILYLRSISLLLGILWGGIQNFRKRYFAFF